MLSLRNLCLPLLGLGLLAQSATAQTTPTHLPTHRVKRMPNARPATRTVPNNTPAARAADPLRGTNDNGAGQSGYAAPGEPITPMQDNGKNTPPYSGPAPRPKPTPRTNTTITTPR